MKTGQHQKCVLSEIWPNLTTFRFEIECQIRLIVNICFFAWQQQLALITFTVNKGYQDSN